MQLFEGEKRAIWSTRLSFAALLLVFSELVVWQAPGDYDALEWLGLLVLYAALGAAALDLLARVPVRDLFGLLIVGGIYGLVNATLISHIVSNDLPLSLIVRPLGAQPLAFVGAFAAYRILASGRATGPLDFLIALAVGVAWGVWVRWFPEVSDEPLPRVPVETVLAVTGVNLVLAGVLRGLVQPGAPYRAIDWTLTPYEWVGVGGVLFVALVIGLDRGVIEGADAAISVVLIAFMGSMLYLARGLSRTKTGLLDPITPPRRPNLVAWLVVVIPFVLGGWIGHTLPGSGDGALQSDILMGSLTAFGIVWLPLVSVAIGVRAFVQLAREQG